jgi:cupin fold WbuC family metalloprotein
MTSISKILKSLNLRKKNERVFYPINQDVLVGMKDVIKISKKLKKDQKIFRICLHKDDKSKIHEMIMVHIKPQKIGPLKQYKKNISYHLLKGELKIKQISNSKTKIFHLNNKKRVHARIKCNVFRVVESLKPMTIFLEISEGPFKDKDTIWKN